MKDWIVKVCRARAQTIQLTWEMKIYRARV